jgi:cytochrome d ubiquinol oxidase subunit I
MVAVGTLFSSFWILATNSWMQTPAGYTIVDGRFYPTDWIEVIFTPSFPYRLVHTVLAFYITSALVVMGVGAYTVRRGRFPEEGRVMMTTALSLLAVLMPMQLIAGDQHGLNTLRYQPAKIAAIEARWDTTGPVPLTLFALPDQAAETNHYAFDVPYLGSLILTHSLDGAIKGLKEFPPDERPPVPIVFFAFRIMVGAGVLMLVLVVVGCLLRGLGRLFASDWYLRACQLAIPLGFIAVLAGWTTTEVGRQPWTVYGLLRTADSVTPSLTAQDVLVSLALYVVAYVVIYPTGFLLILRLVRNGPGETLAVPEVPVQAGRPASPIHDLPPLPHPGGLP